MTAVDATAVNMPEEEGEDKEEGKSMSLRSRVEMEHFRLLCEVSKRRGSWAGDLLHKQQDLSAHAEATWKGQELRSQRQKLPGALWPAS